MYELNIGVFEKLTNIVEHFYSPRKLALAYLSPKNLPGQGNVLLGGFEYVSNDNFHLPNFLLVEPYLVFDDLWHDLQEMPADLWPLEELLLFLKVKFGEFPGLFAVNPRDAVL